MEDSTGSDRPLKRVKYAQQEDLSIATLPENVAMGIIRPVDNVPGSLPDAPLFATPWSLQSGLTSPSEMLLSLSEDLNHSWATALPGEETCRQLSLSLPSTYNFTILPLLSPTLSPSDSPCLNWPLSPFIGP